MKIGVFGASGRMGRSVIEAVSLDSDVCLGNAQVRATSSLIDTDAGEVAGVGKLNVAMSNELNATDVDVMVDFTLPDALATNLEWCKLHQKPLVVGTTGLSTQQQALINDASQHIPVLWSANMSVGVNLLLDLVRQAAKVMGDTADIEIIETHHRHKVDAPSGTAVVLGEAVADALNRDLSVDVVYGREGYTGVRQQNTIGFSTVRGGDVVGDHTVLFADEGERMELTHKASSRLTFANGALRAAKWLKSRPKGLYSMRDVLGL